MEEMNQVAEIGRNYQVESSDDGNYTLAFSGAVQTYSSYVPATFSEKLAYYNAVNSPEFSMRDMINKTIWLKHIFAEHVDFVDKRGNTTPGTRIVFIDEDGHSYKCASRGIYSSVSKLFAIAGQPSEWDQPVPIIFKNITKSADRNVLIFEIDMEALRS